MIELHEHQKQLVADIREAYRLGFNAPLVVLPTGGGKTTIFAYITAAAAEKGSCIFLIAHRSELIKQISQTLGRFDVCHNIVAPAPIIRQATLEHFKEFQRSYIDRHSKVFVASVQTIVRRMDAIKHIPSLLVVDESHHLTDKTQWGKVVARYPDAKLLPVTATPIRLDGKGLGKHCGGFADTIVMGQSMKWLITNGYLCKYRIFCPPNNIDLKKIKTVMGDYKKDDMAEQVDKPTITGDAVKHYRKLADGKRAVVFCININHARHVCDEFNANGIIAEILEGKMESGERNDTIMRFRSGETKVMVTCEIVSEGFDLPAIECAILLRPTKSLSLYLQQVGRALRVLEGKDCAIILDHVGAVMRHGLPDSDREWTLDGVVKKKRKNEEQAVDIKRCHVCFFVHKPAPKCPACGFVYLEKQKKITESDDDLVEITQEQRVLATVKRKKEERDCKTLDDFIELGRQRGYQYPVHWGRKRFSFRQRGNKA